MEMSSQPLVFCADENSGDNVADTENKLSVEKDWTIHNDHYLHEYGEEIVV